MSNFSIGLGCGRPSGAQNVACECPLRARNRAPGFTVIRFRDSVQELRLPVTFWNYARNRVTDQASFCRANPVSFSRAPQQGHMTPVGRSVFHDLGFDEAEARVLEMRADLMAALREHIEKRGWTQSEAAKNLGVTQPRISALMKGAWRDFSADMLLVLATRMGLRPTLKLAA
jgi:predicted XRE-type DNA-binding protein